jgi:hypothetical protein
MLGRRRLDGVRLLAVAVVRSRFFGPFAFRGFFGFGAFDGNSHRFAGRRFYLFGRAFGLSSGCRRRGGGPRAVPFGLLRCGLAFEPF